jgi:hypothetical protein
MEELDGMTTELAKIFAGKEQRRRTLARLPYPEKVQAVMQLQEMAAAILRSRGKIVRVWPVNEAQE